MPSDQPTDARPTSLLERRAQRVANARSVTFGLAASFVLLAIAGAVVMRFVDDKNFPSLGLAIWWALQTVTTVGYGDVVPTSNAGRVVGGIEMVFGIAVVSLLTAAVTSTVIERSRAAAQAEDAAARDRDTRMILTALARLEERLDSTD
jgi:voltage-gated potassium channel